MSRTNSESLHYTHTQRPSPFTLFLSRQPLVQILATDAENLSRFALVPFRRNQRFAYVFSLKLGQRWRANLPRPLRGRDSNALRQIRRRDFRAFANNHRALNDVCQLANVAGKFVSKQKIMRFA